MVCEPKYLTVAEAAKLLRVSPGHVYRAIESGGLRAVRLTERGPIRIPIEALAIGEDERARGRTPAASGAVEPAGAARHEEALK